MTERQITNRIKKLQELEAQRDALQEQIDAIKGEIQGEMLDTEILTVGDFIIRWATVISNRLNTTAIKKELPDIYNKYITQSTSRRFTITATK